LDLSGSLVPCLISRKCHHLIAALEQLKVFDEIVLPNSNTQEMMEEINRRYGGRKGVVYPDPSGSARKTSAPVGQTEQPPLVIGIAQHGIDGGDAVDYARDLVVVVNSPACLLN
jgi:hypothetical protein